MNRLIDLVLILFRQVRLLRLTDGGRRFVLMSLDGSDGFQRAIVVAIIGRRGRLDPAGGARGQNTASAITAPLPKTNSKAAAPTMPIKKMGLGAAGTAATADMANLLPQRWHCTTVPTGGGRWHWSAKVSAQLGQTSFMAGMVQPLSGTANTSAGQPLLNRTLTRDG